MGTGFCGPCLQKREELPKPIVLSDRVNLLLSRDEFELLRQDEQEVHLFDKDVNKVYVYVKAERKWKFPAGSRMDVIALLSAVSL